MKVTGTVIKINKIEEGTSKEGKSWAKLIFVLDTKEDYNNIYAIEVFGQEKIDNFLKYTKEGSEIDVDFNIKTNEWQGKYFTSLQYWKSFKAEGTTPNPDLNKSDDESDDLPFN